MADRMDTVTLMNLLRPMQVHQRVATLRKLHNLSQAALAEETGVERGSVSSWEAEPAQERAHSPGEEARDRMARLFNIPAYVLTSDFGMQNFEQAGVTLGAAEHATVVQPRQIAPRGEERITPVAPAPPVDEQAPNRLPEPGPQVATQQIVQGAQGLERRPILQSPREEVVRQEAQPQQIVKPNPAPAQAERPAPTPPPPGVTRIG